MNILQDITSKDPHRIWLAACAIRKLRNQQELSVLAGHLDQIKESTKNISLGGALRPNSSHLTFAIQKIEFFKNSHGCLCGLYPLDDLFNPIAEEKDGNILILGSTLIDGKWVDHYDCQCTNCGTKYRVEEREYHYPWWSWQRT